MTKPKKTNAPKPAEVQSFKDRALAFDDVAVMTMALEIDASLDRRHLFEEAHGLVMTGATSWERARAQVKKSEVAVSRFFLALGIQPSSVFERQAVEGKMFNAKAIKKIVELAAFSCGIGAKMERVTKAFIACALIASKKNPGEPITNAVNQRFLNASDLGTYIKDADILEHIEELRHKSMSTGADTQSSQARNVLDVLGLGRIAAVDRARDAIVLEEAHPFYDEFRAAYMV